MACEVEWIPLGDIVNLSSGGTPDKKQPAYWDGEIPWISAKTLTGDTVTTSNLFITEEGLHAGSKLAPVGSILLLTRGSGLFKRIPLAIVNAPVAYNQDVKCMTSKVTTITNEYVFFALKALSPELTNMLETTGIGAGKLATDRLLDMPIPVLSHDEREKAVSFFSALSRKIMINNRINDYLADLCETIAGKYCNDRNSCLRDICYQVTDHVDYGNANQETYVSTESLMQNKGGRQLASSLPTAGKITRYKAGDTLISNIRPYFKKIWYAPFEGTCSGDVIVFRANDPSNAPYLHACLRQDSFFDYVMQGAKGTKMPRGDKKQMMEFKVASSCSTKDLILLDSAIKQRSDNDSETVKLQALRDTLLPKLMSGEIDVSKVDLTQLTNNHLADC
ncbi:restriction endonuclease subunit S [Bifidobacterium pseudocatenulatum]|uniref:restriction endonuclease subunit S n=3 Tax=Bifidobacterium pseudocatenulatum TaxID=28026 RepID=UPI00189BC2BC|nr:restriction endonuclease subunit S [Bifidobacterium pseudocatenulatum]MCH4858153.1 restriction endonuclease subunit S [Bifidobacterium pseudocatenulatum]UDG90724.1 restriction endonuclease subunit S [Bifidobacterium pseudocatenulatum]